MTFTYNGAEVAKGDGALRPAAPVAAAASSWAWGAIASRVAAGCGLAACGFFCALAESVTRAICGMIAVALQALLFEWVREWFVRRRERRMRAVGEFVQPDRRHPVLRWLAVFVAIEVACVLVVVLVWFVLTK